MGSRTCRRGVSGELEAVECDHHVGPIAVDAIGAVAFGTLGGFALDSALGDWEDDERPMLLWPAAIASLVAAGTFVVSTGHGVRVRGRCKDLQKA